MLAPWALWVFKQTYTHRISMLRMKNDAISQITTKKCQGKGSSSIDAAASGGKGRVASLGSGRQRVYEVVLNGRPSPPWISHHSARDRSCVPKHDAGTSSVQSIKWWRPPQVLLWSTRICKRSNSTSKEVQILLASSCVIFALFKFYLLVCFLSFFEQMYGHVLAANSLESKVNKREKTSVFWPLLMKDKGTVRSLKKATRNDTCISRRWEAGLLGRNKNSIGQWRRSKFWVSYSRYSTCQRGGQITDFYKHQNMGQLQ